MTIPIPTILHPQLLGDQGSTSIYIYLTPFFLRPYRTPFFFSLSLISSPPILPTTLTMSDSTSYCSDCACITNSVFDHASGDLICSDCGLVLDSHFIDDSREWRTFSNSDSGDHDPNRVGEANSTFFTSHLTTFTSKPNSTPAVNGLNSDPKPDSISHVGRTAYRMMNKGEGQFNKALATISHMSDQLGLISSITHLAQHLYSTFHPQVPSSFRGKHHDAFLGACLYVACTQEGLPRTVKEISSVANGASKKDILRAKAFVTKHLLPDSDPQRDEDNNTVAAAHEKAVRAGDLVKRFCSNVGMMNHRVMKAAQEAVDKLEGETDVRRSPVSVDGYVSSSLEDCSILVCSATSDQ